MKFIHQLWAGLQRGKKIFEEEQTVWRCYELMLLHTALLFCLGLVSIGWAQGSAENLVRAQEGMGEQSWPKKPGNQESQFSGKMTDFKQIDMKNYEKGKSFHEARLYGDRKESSLASTPLWEQRGSKMGGKESSWSGRQTSGMDARRNQEYGDGQISSWQKKEELEMKSVASKKGPDWISRASPKFQNHEGGVVMYEGRLTRVRETVVRDDSSGQRDLGGGRKEMFSPTEVQRLLEAKGRTTDPHQPAPVKGEIRAESAGAFRPVVAGSSPSSP
ncbi:MAG: hypothetical protein QM531_04075 [Candidatus Pacebacteria bacterium]|nr:hypothetical protein [Candidatus Paceibacterota bacterium]